MCQTVIPVAGLLAQAAAGLREAEFRALAAIAAMPQSDRDDLVMSVDRFRTDNGSAPLTAEERSFLLERYGLFGVRTAVELLADGEVSTASELSRALAELSGIGALRDLLAAYQQACADVVDRVRRSPRHPQGAIGTVGAA